MNIEQNDPQQKDRNREYGTKILLMAIFLAGFGLFIYWRSGQVPGLAEFRLSWLDLTMLALAAYRLGRLIAYDVVMEPFRRPFARTVPDGTGAGESVEARGTGARRAIGQLISCPICAGTWIAAFMVYGLYAFPGPARVFLAIMAAIGAAELLNSLTEILCWSGQYAREMTGLREQARKRSGGDDHRSRGEMLVPETLRNGNDSPGNQN
jgi:hypothetical protein